MKSLKWLFVLFTSLTIVTGCSKMNGITLMHIHGLGYSSDGKQILIPAHDSMLAYSNGKWSTIEGKKHDYMGFTVVDNGFYSSGHPAPDAGMKNPLGIVKSTDNGKTLQLLDLYGIEDFHGMSVGYKSHAIYVFNPKPNAKMSAAGVYYSTDDTKTWKKSDTNGISGEPLMLAAHPTDPMTVAIGTKNGLFLSKDYGNHFEASSLKSTPTALAFGTNGDLWIGGSNSLVEQTGKELIQIKIPVLDQDDAVAYIAQNPLSDHEIVFATYKKSVYRSSDKGVVWEKIINYGEGIHK